MICCPSPLTTPSRLAVTLVLPLVLHIIVPSTIRRETTSTSFLFPPSIRMYTFGIVPAVLSPWVTTRSTTIITLRSCWLASFSSCSFASAFAFFAATRCFNVEPAVFFFRLRCFFASPSPSSPSPGLPPASASLARVLVVRIPVSPSALWATCPLSSDAMVWPSVACVSPNDCVVCSICWFLFRFQTGRFFCSSLNASSFSFLRSRLAAASFSFIACFAFAANGNSGLALPECFRWFVGTTNTWAWTSSRFVSVYPSPSRLVTDDDSPKIGHAEEESAFATVGPSPLCFRLRFDFDFGLSPPPRSSPLSSSSSSSSTAAGSSSGSGSTSRSQKV